MKKLLPLFFILNFCFVFSQTTTRDYTLQIKVTVKDSPPALLFQWDQDTSAVNYTISRKLKDATSWTVIAGSLPDTTSQFTDQNISPGNAYEYRFQKSNATYNSYAYTYSGIDAPAIEQRGKIILLVDSLFSTPLEQELNLLMMDFRGDGWTVIRHDVSRNDSVSSVKNLILDDFNSDTAKVKAVMLLGHIPVPYSGNLAPDGHTDHFGAWPADLYYGTMFSIWTDVTVNATSASRPENINVPGDGKFDQSLFQGSINLQVGRVDFANLPLFAFTEEELMRRYLEKDHAYRNKFFATRQRALVDDNFGVFGGEAFGSCGWRLSSLVGPDSISDQDYFPTLNTEPYQWSYGCGGGTYTSCGGVGSTTDFTTDSVQTIFSMLFGSYFGDWDSENNFMRSALASGSALACSWAGRPYWHYHHMGLGENIGYSARLSQNNNSLYVSNNSGHGVHIALMGDPTLRMHIIAPPSVLTASDGGNNQVLLTWNASPDSVLGYYVYRYDSSAGTYNRISPSIVATTVYTDVSPLNNINQYMVRAIRLEHAASGTYYNLSQGIFDSLTIVLGTGTIASTISRLDIFPNPCTTEFTVDLLSRSSKNAMFQLLDLKGQTIIEISQPLITGSNRIQISTRNLSKGIYMLKVIIHGEIFHKKIVVANG
jgi:hypothetical protein